MRVTEEQPLAGTAVDKLLVRHSEDFHDTRQLLLFVLAGEDGESRIQLCQDAAQTPHIDGHVVVHAENNFWGTIEATLDVCVDLKRGSDAGITYRSA